MYNDDGWREIPSTKTHFASGWYKWEALEHGSHTPGAAHFFIPEGSEYAHVADIAYLTARRLCDRKFMAVDNLKESDRQSMHCNKCARVMSQLTNGEARVLTKTFGKTR